MNLEPKTFDRANVRELLTLALRTDSELDAFVCDYFQATYRNFTNGMDRVAKVTLLLNNESTESLHTAVAAYQSKREALVARSLPAPVHAASGDTGRAASPSAEWGGFNLLRHPGELFVGRERELRVLREGLTGSFMRIGVVTGPAGIGKSSLMYCLSSVSKELFRSSLCIDCTDAPGIARLLALISSWLLSQGNPFLEQAMRDPQLSLKNKLPIAVRALEEGGPYLLGFDNFEALLTSKEDVYQPEDENIALFLSLLSTGLQKTKILIASRLRFHIDAQLRSVLFVHPYELSKDEAVQLMGTLPNLDRHGNRDEFAALWEQGVRNPGLIDLMEGALTDYDLVEIKRNLRGKLQSDLVAAQQLDLIYAKLPEPAQALVRRVAVYREPVTIAMLEAHVPNSGAIHKSLNALLDRNLLNAVDIRFADTKAGKICRKHYRMHEVARQWAEQKLYASEGEDGYRQTQRRAGYAYLRQLLGDSRQRVLEYAASGWHFLHAAGEGKAAGYLAVILANAIERQIHPDAARRILEPTFRQLQGKDETWRLIAYCHIGLSSVELRQGSPALATEHMQHALELGLRRDDRSVEAASLQFLAQIQLLQGKTSEASEKVERSLQISRELKDARLIAGSQIAAAMVEHAKLNGVVAIQLCLEAVNSMVAVFAAEGTADAQEQAQAGLSADEKTLLDACHVLQAMKDFFFVADLGARMVEWAITNFWIHELVTKNKAPWKQIGERCEILFHLTVWREDAATMAHLLALKALLEYRQGNIELFSEFMNQSIQISLQQGNLHGTANKLAFLASAEQDRGQIESARIHYGKYLEIEKQLNRGTTPMAIFCLGRLAHLEDGAGNLAAARAKLLQALSGLQIISEQTPVSFDIWRIAMLKRLADLERKMGLKVEARHRIEEWTRAIEVSSRVAEATGQMALLRMLRKQLHGGVSLRSRMVRWFLSLKG